MAKIFISYARADGHEIADEFADRLRALKHEVFLDIQGIPGGVHWEAELVRNIEWCDVLLIVMTPVSNQSEHVYNEFRQAEIRNKLIIPIQVDNTAFPSHLKKYNALPLKDGNYDAPILKIMVAITEHERRTQEQQAVTATQSQIQSAPTKTKSSLPIAFIVIPILMIAGILLVVLLMNNNNNAGTSDETRVAQNPTNTDTPNTQTNILTVNNTPAITHTATQTRFEQLTATAQARALFTPTATFTPTAVPEELILYQEDFEDRIANGFTIWDGTWTVVQDGNNYVYQARNDGWVSHALIESSTWANYVIEGRFRWVEIGEGNPDGRITICVRSQESSQLDSYNWFIDPESVGVLRLRLVGSRWVNEEEPDLITYHINYYPSKIRWHTFRIEVFDSGTTTIIRTWLNGHQFNDVYDEDSPYPVGGILLRVEANTTVYFDDILIYEIPDSELP